jgi:hypothetical protein
MATAIEKAQAKILAAKQAREAETPATQPSVAPQIQQQVTPAKKPEIKLPPNRLQETFWSATPNHTVYPAARDPIKFSGHTIILRNSADIFFMRQLVAQFPYRFKSLG